jgi:hypothetical protein
MINLQILGPDGVAVRLAGVGIEPHIFFNTIFGLDYKHVFQVVANSGLNTIRFATVDRLVYPHSHPYLIPLYFSPRAY